MFYSAAFFHTRERQVYAYIVCLTTHFAVTHGRALGSPRGRAGETPARAARLRGEPRSKTERANFLRHILTLAKTGPLVYNKTGEIYPDGQPRRASARPARRGAWAEKRAVRSVLCGMFFILSYLSRIIRPYRIVQRAGEGRAVPGPCPRL